MRRQPTNKATFYDVITIDLSGSAGYGASLEVEVEYTATRGNNEPANSPDAIASEVEIVCVRPFNVGIVEATGRKGTKRQYLDRPKWLCDLLTECVDTDALDPDWREVE
jgi:hypothetical protein